MTMFSKHPFIQEVQALPSTPKATLAVRMITRRAVRSGTNGRPPACFGAGARRLDPNSRGQAAVDQQFNDVMVWSQDAAYMPVWGNHEWDRPKDDDLRNYKGRFALPNSQTSPDAPQPRCWGKDWYWFDYGNVRFIAYPEPSTAETWSAWYDKGEYLDGPGADRPGYYLRHDLWPPSSLYLRLSSKRLSTAILHPDPRLSLQQVRA